MKTAEILALVGLFMLIVAYNNTTKEGARNRVKQNGQFGSRFNAPSPKKRSK